MKHMYEIMHADRNAASIDESGFCRIFDKNMLPMNLWLDTGEGIDERVNNLTNFYYWCSGRLITLERKYAKELLNAIGARQPLTDKDRAEIALSYHCLTLTDLYWVKESETDISFADINLYENHLENAFVDISLRGRQLSVQNTHLAASDASCMAGDLSTSGVFPKAWVRKADGFYLYKYGAEDEVERELLASRIARCFNVPQVLYEPGEYDGLCVSVSKLFTGLKTSIATREAFEIFAVNNEIDPLLYILELDSHGYYMMNIIDYLVGNTDRHWGNWGLLINNADMKPVRLHDLMDFNRAFNAYDDIEGGVCLTGGWSEGTSAGSKNTGKRMTQKEAALEAVSKIGLNQICAVSDEWFTGHDQWREMFRSRVGILHSVDVDLKNTL